jgi:hypothetical protein
MPLASDFDQLKLFHEEAQKDYKCWFEFRMKQFEINRLIMNKSTFEAGLLLGDIKYTSSRINIPFYISM